MTLCAIIPIASLDTANNTLESAGFGPGNFSVPAYTGAGATHAGLHTRGDLVFEAAVKAIAGVFVDASNGVPATRFQALVEARGAKWGDNAPELPASGSVTAGDLYRVDESLWSVIQAFNRTTFGLSPETYPALIRRVRDPKQTEDFKKPLDQFDSYNLKNPFTGEADRVVVDGKTYRTLVNANVWKPPSAQWQEIDPKTGEPVKAAIAPWVQPTAANPYPMNARVTHNERTWENTGSPANVWEPGAFGWVVVQGP